MGAEHIHPPSRLDRPPTVDRCAEPLLDLETPSDGFPKDAEPSPQRTPPRPVDQFVHKSRSGHILGPAFNILRDPGHGRAEASQGGGDRGGGKAEQF